MSEGHEWRAGDLCTYVSANNSGWGVLYRVESIEEHPRFGPRLFNLVPVFATFFSITKRHRMKQVLPEQCTHMSLVDLATAYAKFGLFIAEEAKRRQ